MRWFLLLWLVASSASAAQKISLTPSPVDCGAPKVGQSNTVVVTIANTGNADLKVTAISKPANTEFTFAGIPQFPIKLPAGTSFGFNIVFTPTSPGSHSGSTTISSDDPLNGQLTLALSGASGNGSILLDAGTIPFGKQRVGLPSMAVPVLISNPGFGDLHVTAIGLDQGHTSDWVISSAKLPGTIGLGGSAPFSLQFQPTATGARMARVAVASDGDNGAATTHYVYLYGTGSMASPSVAPAMADFGSQHLFVASNPKSLTLSNSGNDAAYLQGVEFSGANAMAFAVAALPTYPAKIPAGGSLVLNLVAVPLVLGTNTATVTMKLDDPAIPTLSVGLSSSGVSGSILVDPGYLDFALQPTGETSAPRTVTLLNQGDDALAITSFAITAAKPAVFVSNNGLKVPATIPPQGMVKFDVTFAPTVAASYLGTVDLKTDDPNAHLVKIPLSGVGVSGGIAVDKATLEFGSVTLGASSAVQSVKLTNSGLLPATVQSMTLTGSAPQAYAVEPEAPFAIDPGQTIAIRLLFTPLLAVDANALCKLQVAGMPNAIVVLLHGKGVGPKLNLTSGGQPVTSVDFGEVAPGMSSDSIAIDMTNAGTNEITVATIASSDPSFIVDRAGTKLMLAPAVTGRFQLRFAPLSTGAKTATLTVAALGGTGLASLSLMGTAVNSRHAGPCAIGIGRARSTGGAWLALYGGVLLLRRKRRCCYCLGPGRGSGTPAEPPSSTSTNSP